MAKQRPEDKRGAHQFFAHPFIITVVGGILLTFAGFIFQQSQATIDYQRQLNDKKLEVAATLPVQLYKSLGILINASFLQTELKASKNDQSYKFSLERTRQETLSMYQKLFDEYQKSSQATFRYKVYAWFQNKSVIDAAEELDKTIELFMDNQSKNMGSLLEEEIEKFDKETTKLLKKLNMAMVAEVREG